MQPDPFKDFNKGLPPEFQAMMPILIGIWCVAILIGLIIRVFYCLTMSKALSRCAEQNRLMSPGMVWLLFIPCWDLVWNFFIVLQVPASLKKEFEDRGKDDGSDYGKNIGLWSMILMIGSAVLSVIPLIGPCFGLTSLVGLVLWIMYWVKISGYSNQLGDSSPSVGALGADD